MSAAKLSVAAPPPPPLAPPPPPLAPPAPPPAPPVPPVEGCPPPVPAVPPPSGVVDPSAGDAAPSLHAAAKTTHNPPSPFTGAHLMSRMLHPRRAGGFRKLRRHARKPQRFRLIETRRKRSVLHHGRVSREARNHVVRERGADPWRPGPFWSGVRIGRASRG